MAWFLRYPMRYGFLFNGEDSNRESHKREMIDTGKDKRYVRRDEQGRFSESDDQRKSLRADRRQRAKRAVKTGQGENGDQVTR